MLMMVCIAAGTQLTLFISETKSPDRYRSIVNGPDAGGGIRADDELGLAAGEADAEGRTDAEGGACPDADGDPKAEGELSAELAAEDGPGAPDATGARVDAEGAPPTRGAAAV